jgi:hypothetical protein
MSYRTLGGSRLRPIMPIDYLSDTAIELQFREEILVYNLKQLAVATAVIVMSGTAAYAQSTTQDSRAVSDVPSKCRNLSDPERSQCIRDAQSAKESSKVEPSAKAKDDGKAPKTGTPTPATPPASTKGGKPGEG